VLHITAPIRGFLDLARLPPTRPGSPGDLGHTLERGDFEESYMSPPPFFRRAAAPALSALALLLASPAAQARDVELRWVEGGGATIAGYVAYVRSAFGGYDDGTDLGLPSPDSDHVLSTVLEGVDDEDVFIALASYDEDGIESVLSNEFFSRAQAGLPPAAPEDITIAIADGATTPILDATESLLVQVAGLSLAYHVTMDPRGRLRGGGVADLDDDGAFETTFSVKGKIKGKDGLLSSKLKMKVRGDAGNGKTSLRTLIHDDIDASLATGIERLRARGKLEGESTQADVENVSNLDTGDLGWTLRFQIDETAEGNKKPAAGTLYQGEGRAVLPVTGTARQNETDGTWKVRLASSGDVRGTRLQLDDLALSANRDVLAGRLRYKAFGQKGELALPVGL